jgi:hypothetical protein
MSGYAATYEKGFDTPEGVRIWTLIGEKLESLKGNFTNQILNTMVSDGKTLNSYIIDAYNSFTNTEVNDRFSTVSDITQYLQKAGVEVNECLKENDFPIVERFKKELRECQVLVRVYDQYCLNNVLQEIAQGEQPEVDSVIRGRTSVTRSLAELRASFESSDNEE